MNAKKLNKIARSKVDADYRKEVLSDYKDFIKAVRISAKQGKYELHYTIDFNGYRGFYRYHAYRLFRIRHRDFKYKTKYRGSILDGNCLKNAEFNNYKKADKVELSINWE